LRRVIWNTAHRHAIAFCQRDVQQTRCFFCVLEKELVKISEPKKQQRVVWDATPQPAVLLHHRSKRVLHRAIIMQNPAMNEKNLESGRQESGIRFGLAPLRFP
jgi:hypothetical protein